MTVIRTSVLVESTFLPEMKGDKHQTLSLPTPQYLRKPSCTKVVFLSLTAACLPNLSGSCSRWLRLPCVCRPNHLKAFVFIIVSRSTAWWDTLGLLNDMAGGIRVQLWSQSALQGWMEALGEWTHPFHGWSRHGWPCQGWPLDLVRVGLSESKFETEGGTSSRLESRQGWTSPRGRCCPRFLERVQGWSESKVAWSESKVAWSESQVGASPRLERVPGWSESKVGASPRWERVQGWSESKVGASPKLEQVQGWSEYKVGASPKLE